MSNLGYGSEGGNSPLGGNSFPKFPQKIPSKEKVEPKTSRSYFKNGLNSANYWQGNNIGGATALSYTIEFEVRGRSRSVSRYLLLYLYDSAIFRNFRRASR